MNGNESGFSLGGKLRDLRLKNGLTQEELADRAELSKGFLRRWHNPSDFHAVRLLLEKILGRKHELRLVVVRKELFQARPRPTASII